MDLEKIKDLMQQFEDSEMRELEIDDGQFHLYLSKNKLAKCTATQKKTVKDETQTAEASKSESKHENSEDYSTDTAVKSPLVGVVYLQAKPGQPTFVSVGDHIKKGQTVCIIEAMKMMTEVKSTLTGTVTAINVENEDLVEVDQPLISVKED